MTSDRLENVDAILFDFDGVIFDTVTSKANVFREMILERAPQHVDPIMDYFHAHGGVSRVAKFEWIWEHILNLPLTKAEAEMLGAEFAQRVRECVLNADFVPGAEMFLEDYHEIHPLFVISGTPETELRDLIRTRGIDGYFRGIFGSPDKKDTIGNRIIEEHGFERKRVWFIGDATTDRDAALQLNVQFVGIRGPHLDPYLTGDEIVIDDLHELAAVLDGLD